MLFGKRIHICGRIRPVPVEPLLGLAGNTTQVSLFQSIDKEFRCKVVRPAIVCIGSKLSTQSQLLNILKIGNDILFNEEKIRVDRITGHGGLFKTKGVGQRILAAAINSPISVMETAGEGGAWGIALLASYLANNGNDQSLADFLDKHVFTGNAGIEISPTAEDVSGFNTYIESYKAGLPIEEAAVRFKN